MTYAPQNALVWAELPVSDMQKAIAFYSKTTGNHAVLDETGPKPIAIFQIKTPGAGTSLHIHVGKPAGDGRGPTVHLASEGTIEDSMKRVKEAGGEVVSGIIDIPPGRFFYAKDPDGNSIGFFETRT